MCWSGRVGLGDDSRGIVDGGAEGAFFADDADEEAEHHALGEVFLVAGVERAEDKVSTVVGEFLDSDESFMGAEENDVADFGDVGALEDEGVAGFEEGHHGVRGDFAGKASAYVAHFGGYVFKGIAGEGVCPVNFVGGGHVSDGGNGDEELAGWDEGGAYFNFAFLRLCQGFCGG